MAPRGTASVARLSGNFQDRDVTTEEAINKSNVAQFILARESYDSGLIGQRNWRTTLSMAGPAVAPVVARLTVRVELAAALKDKVKPDDTVFIFARASNGPPMPLAAKRVTVAQLPIEVELSDADAMMPQMKLSDFTEVQLVARVSRAGQPTHGEWIGQGSPLATATQATQHLTIDSPDP